MLPPRPVRGFREEPHRDELVADGGYDRLNGSLELSIKSVRMNVASLRLLSMLGTPPDGVEPTDLDALMLAPRDAVGG